MSKPHLLIGSIKVGVRFRKDIGNIETLANSIREVGLLHPIVVSEKHNLIAGYRRLKACVVLGWTEVPVNIVKLTDLLKGEFHENVVRKGFTTSEMVAIKRYFEPELTIGQGARTDLTSGNLPEVHRTRDVLGSFVGVSGKTLEKAEAIVEATEQEPEKFSKLLAKVDDGKISINAAHTQIKRAEKHATPPKLPEGEYDVVYADPPWEYDFSLRGGPDSHYDVIALPELCNLKVPSSENAILFLWATNPRLKEALQVVKAWGFEYKTNMVWVKQKFGTGYYFRGQHELLLVAKKGDIPAPMEETRPSSVLTADSREHSVKPVEVYQIIEQLYPNRKYLELFARKKREGWTSWGDELE